MDDKTSELNILDPRGVMEVNASPLQLPSRDERLRTSVIGGPKTGGDRRFLLSVKTLEHLLAVAKSSPVRRAQVNYAGVRVDLYRRSDGHQYEVWQVIGSKPIPEPLPSAVESMISGAAGQRTERKL